MSAYATVQTEYRDEEALCAALADLGYPVERHAEGAHLYGYHGDQRPETAHVIVRRQHVGGSSNDVGYARQANGTYAAIVSEFDRGHRFTAAVQAKLKARYGVRAVTNAATRKGYTVASESTPDGRVKLTLRRFS